MRKTGICGSNQKPQHTQDAGKHRESQRLREEPRLHTAHSFWIEHLLDREGPGFQWQQEFWLRQVVIGFGQDSGGREQLILGAQVDLMLRTMGP